VTKSAGGPGQRNVRSEGQWAAGDRQPLNDNERIKLEDDGLNVRRRIEDVYSRTGIAGVDLTDRRSRFRWWGMYTQRKPGIPGNTIGSLAPEDLEDDCFMMRVRIDGGALTTKHYAFWAKSRVSSPATPLTSPTGRMSSCTGCTSRTSHRFGSGSNRWA
jgi:sulfite reductase (ferredoxin)